MFGIFGLDVICTLFLVLKMDLLEDRMEKGQDWLVSVDLKYNSSLTSFNRTVKLLHYFHPYKLQHMHILNLGVKVKRVAMATHVVQKNTSNHNWFAIFWMSDEAVFFLNGNVISKNIIRYSKRRIGLSEDFTIVSTCMKKSWAGRAGVRVRLLSKREQCYGV